VVARVREILAVSTQVRTRFHMDNPTKQDVKSAGILGIKKINELARSSKNFYTLPTIIRIIKSRSTSLAEQIARMK
jgi:hypothetical protein